MRAALCDSMQCCCCKILLVHTCMQACSSPADAEKNALRLSMVVRRNLETDAAAGGSREYADVSAGTGAADVRLHTPDAEVDFDERASEAGQKRSRCTICAHLQHVFSHSEAGRCADAHAPSRGRHR